MQFKPAFFTAAAVFPLSEETQSLEHLQNNYYTKEQPQPHKSIIITLTSMLSLPGQDWEVCLLRWSSATDSPPQEQKDCWDHSTWRPNDCKPPFLGLALTGFEVNHWIMALAAVTGCKCLLFSMEFTHSSQKNPSVLEEFFHTEGYPTCPASGGTRHQFPQPLGTALNQFLSPLKMQLTIAIDCAGMKYHIVYEEGNREWILALFP